MSYYVEFIEKVNEIKKEDPLQAYYLVKEELAMPYIEKSIEIQLQALLEELKVYLPKPQYTINVEEDLMDEHKVMNAIEYLRQVNIRSYIDVIEKFLKSDKDALLKGMLIMVLIEQQYYEEIHMQKDDLEIQFHPNQLELPFENEVIIQMHHEIEQTLQKHPQLMENCIDYLYEKAIAHLPFSYEESEKSMILKEIYYDILTIFNENTLLEKIIT